MRAYEFDRDLRLVMFGAIAEIEIFFRGRLSYLASGEDGIFGFPESVKPRLSREYSAANKGEQFIKHFVAKYGDEHDLPPYWMMVDGEDGRDPLVAHRHHPEQKPCPVGIGGKVPPLVQDDEAAPAEPPERVLRRPLLIRTPQLAYQLRRRPERDFSALAAGEQPQGYRGMGLAVARSSEEHQVLAGVDEGKREHVVPREAAGKHDSRPFEAIEALLRGKVRLPPEARYPASAPERVLLCERIPEERELPIGGRLGHVAHRRLRQQDGAALALGALQPLVARTNLLRQPGRPGRLPWA